MDVLAPVVVAVVAAVVVVVLLVWVVATYNRLVRLRNKAREAWAQIDVQLQRRHDLIGNLVDTVTGYADHERGTLEEVTRARARADTAQGPRDQAEAEHGLTRALKSLFAVAEDYPELTANQNFRALQDELTATEDRISFTRQLYNTAVRRFDDARQVFPTNLVAGPLGFRGREYFDVDDPTVTDPARVEF